MKDYIKNIVDKNIYIVDSESIYYFEDLRSSLLNEIKRDTIENSEDKGIVESNLKLLDKFYNNNYGYNENWIIEELIKFGYSIMKLKDLQDNLLTLKTYWKYNGSKDINNELVDKVEKLNEEINNYFND